MGLYLGTKSISAFSGGGNQFDWNQNDSSQPDYVKNRPGGYKLKDAIDITWDGNVEGLTSVYITDTQSLYKISDVIFTTDEIIGATVTFSDNNFFSIAKSDLHIENEYPDLLGISSNRGLIAYVVLKNNINVSGIIFPEAGLYAAVTDSYDFYIQSIHKDQTYVKIPEDLLDLSNFKSEFNTLSDNVDNLYNNNAALAYSEAQSAKTIAEAAKTAASNAVGADVVKGDYILRSGQLLYQQYGFSVLLKRNNTEKLLSYLGDNQLIFNPNDKMIRMYLSNYTLELGNPYKPNSIRLLVNQGSESSCIEICDNNGDTMTIEGDGHIDAPDKIIKFRSNILRDVKSPELSSDAVNKEYVDNRISEKEITLLSSTSGSTKKFKITVDDSGNLSTTEMTT